MCEDDDATIESIMQEHVITVGTLDDKEQVAQMFSKYNFLQNTPTLLVSQETFTQLFGSEHAHNRLVIKLKEGLSDRDYATIVDTTRSL